jgi:hypothetical protein
MAYFTLILYRYFKTALYKSCIVFSNQLPRFHPKMKTARPHCGRAVVLLLIIHPLLKFRANPVKNLPEFAAIEGWAPKST